MPLTINGIGTMYYGKRNPRQYPGTCDYCRKSVQLTDYETTLYFVVLYIPVIPLGRKQLLSACPACRRHAVMSAKKWQQIKQQSILAGTQALATQMENAEVGLGHLYNLSGFGEIEEARDLAEALELQHAAVADVQLALGAWHEQYGQKADSDRCFQNAFKLQPTNPAMIRAQGLTLMEQGQLNEARELLSQLQPPHPNFDASLFSTLARAFQARERHAEALELFKIAASDPVMKRDQLFQKLVKKSERVTGQKSDFLPPVRIWQQRRYWLAAAVAGLACLWLLATWYQGEHRKLNIINPSKQRLLLEIDSGGPINLFPNSQTFIDIAEGMHQVKILQPAEAAGEKTFLIQTPFWQRAFVNPSCTLDPLESGFVYWRKVWYHEQPDDSRDELDTHFGQLYLQYPHVDFEFMDFPREISLRNGRPESRTGIKFEPLTVAMLEDSGLQGEALLDRAEQLMKLQDFPVTDGLAYYLFCQKQGELMRALGFFEKLLPRRPVLTGIHRLYQGLQDKTDAAGKELRQLYDGMLGQEPDNPDLLYLRSCLETRYSDAGTYLDRALELNPQQNEALMRKSYAELSSGNFAQALKLRGNDRRLIEALFALENYEALFSRLSAIEGVEGEDDGSDLDRFLTASRLYYCTGKDLGTPPRDRAEQQLCNWLDSQGESPLAWKYGGVAGLAQQQLDSGDFWIFQIYSAYLRGDRALYQQLLQGIPPQIEDPSYWKFLDELENGSVIALAKLADEWEDEIDAQDELLVALRLAMEGEQEQAKAWLESAVQRLQSGDRTDRAWAGLLRQAGEQTVSAAEIREVIDMPASKAVYAATVAAFSPTPDPEVLALARLYNFDPSPPHRFTARVLEKLGGKN